MICYQQSFSTLNVNILVLHLISPFFGFTGFHQPMGWFRRKSLPKLADFSLSGAKGEILMYRTHRKIQNLDQNFSPKSRKCCKISPCLKALAWPLALVFFNNLSAVLLYLTDKIHHQPIYPPTHLIIWSGIYNDHFQSNQRRQVYKLPFTAGDYVTSRPYVWGGWVWIASCLRQDRSLCLWPLPCHVTWRGDQDTPSPFEWLWTIPVYLKQYIWPYRQFKVGQSG